METFPYYLVAFSLALAAVLNPTKKPNFVAWAIAFVVLTLFIGLRHKVGMDWNNYVRIADWISGATIIESFQRAEPGFALFTWVSTRLGTGIYGVHLVGAVVFCLGLFRLCSTTDNAWMGLLVSFPILITAVANSASRQIIAIGILMWLLAEWKEASLKKRIAIILLACAFHYSAAFMLVFAALELNIGRVAKTSLVVLLAGGTILLMQMTGGGDYYITTYVTEQDELTFSPGAFQHIALNAAPAALMILGRRVRARLFPSQLMIQYGLLAMALIPLAAVASVAAGRISLYLFPVSIYAFTGLPSIFSTPLARALVRLLVAFLMLMILWIWLNFANSAYAHIPYMNVLWVHPTELHL